jgi:PAS domain S-box-containing protein
VVFVTLPEQKKGQNMIESEKFAHRVLNTSLNGIYIHDVKLGQNIFINSRYTALTGYTSDDLTAMDKAKFFELFHPDDRQRVAAHMEKLAGGSDDMLEIEYRFKTKDGRWIWCLSRDSVFERNEDGSVSQFIGTFLDITKRKQEEIIRTPATGELRHRQVSSAPVRDMTGNIIGSVSVVRDITDQKRAEEALRDSEEQLKRAQEIAHLGSWELDLLSNQLTWSDEVYRIFGLQPQEFGASYEAFLEYVHPDDRAGVNAAFSDSVREGRNTYEIEHRIIRKSTGEVRWVQEKCRHIRDASGRITRSLGMVLDITERKKAEQSLKKAHDELEEKVKERAYELEATVNSLQVEVEERRDAESRLRQLSRVFMDAADPIIIENLSGTILDMNREAECAYSWKRQDLIGKSIKSIIAPERYQWAQKLRKSCLSGEEVRNWEGMPFMPSSA